MAECTHRGTMITYNDTRGMPVCHGCGESLESPAKLLRAIYAMNDDQWRLEMRAKVLMELLLKAQASLRPDSMEFDPSEVDATLTEGA